MKTNDLRKEEKTLYIQVVSDLEQNLDETSRFFLCNGIFFSVHSLMCNRLKTKEVLYDIFNKRALVWKKLERNSRRMLPFC